MTVFLSIIIFLNLFVTLRGLANPLFFGAWALDSDRIRFQKEYYRVLTSGFLHQNWIQLLFNMLVLYAIGTGLEFSEGPLFLLIVYFVSLCGANMLRLYLQRNNSPFRTSGASGAVAGIVFAAIALYPGMMLSVFFIPFGIPAWIIGALFMVYAIYGIHSRLNTSSHEAHLGGALLGILCSVCLRPGSAMIHLSVVLLLFIPGLAFLILIIRNPSLLIIGYRRKKKEWATIDEKYNLERKIEQEEIDSILDKIAGKGMDSLTPEEKRKLDRYSMHMKR